MNQTSNEVQSIINGWTKKQIDNAHVSLPGIITGYDSSKNLATVKPTGNYQAEDGRYLPYPVIYNAPLVFPTGSGGGAGITFPIKPGDGCLIVFSDEALSGYLSGSGKNQDPRKHSMNDAIVIPGLYPNGATSNSQYPNETCLTCEGSIVRLNGSHLIISLADGTSATFSDGDLVVSNISSVHHTHMGVHGETSPPL